MTGEGVLARVRERVNMMLTMRISASAYGKTGYGGERHVQTKRRGDRESCVAWPDS